MCLPPKSDNDPRGTMAVGNSNDASTTGEYRQISNEELRAHNTPKSAWASVHGKVIDITEFGKRHPGGDIIFLSSGKDATILVETYHPRGVPNSLIKKLQVCPPKGIIIMNHNHQTFH